MWTRISTPAWRFQPKSDAEHPLLGLAYSSVQSPKSDSKRSTKSQPIDVPKRNHSQVFPVEAQEEIDTSTTEAVLLQSSDNTCNQSSRGAPHDSTAVAQQLRRTDPKNSHLCTSTTGCSADAIHPDTALKKALQPNGDSTDLDLIDLFSFSSKGSSRGSRVGPQTRHQAKGQYNTEKPSSVSAFSNSQYNFARQKAWRPFADQNVFQQFSQEIETRGPMDEKYMPQQPVASARYCATLSMHDRGQAGSVERLQGAHCQQDSSNAYQCFGYSSAAKPLSEQPDTADNNAQKRTEEPSIRIMRAFKVQTEFNGSQAQSGAPLIKPESRPGNLLGHFQQWWSGQAAAEAAPLHDPSASCQQSTPTPQTSAGAFEVAQRNSNGVHHHDLRFLTPFRATTSSGHSSHTLYTGKSSLLGGSGSYSSRAQYPPTYSQASINDSNAWRAVEQWRQATKWLLLWLILSLLTVIHSAALVFSISHTLFAAACVAMFSWSGVLGVCIAVRALISQQLVGHKEAQQAVNSLALKSLEIMGFACSTLSGIAATAYLITANIVLANDHISKCEARDTNCAEGYDTMIVMIVSTTVLYVCHCTVSIIVVYLAHSARCMAKSFTSSSAVLGGFAWSRMTQHAQVPVSETSSLRANSAGMEPDANDSEPPAKETEVAEAVAQTLSGAETSPALRESQIQNAVSFLGHPKVQGSSESAKTSFLEKKGLTAAEIKEAFSRVGNPPAASTPIASTASPALPAAAPYQGTQATISALQQRQALQQLPYTDKSLRWTQALIGASALFAGAYALKQLLSPLVLSLYRRFYGTQDTSRKNDERRLEEKRTAEIVAAAIESQTKELKSTVDSLKDMVTKLNKGKQTAYSSSGLSVEDLRSELQAFASTFTSAATPRPSSDADLKSDLAQIKQLLNQRAVGNGDFSPKPRGSNSTYQQYPGSSALTRVAPPAARALQKQEADIHTPDSTDSAQPSYMEVLEMLERGETPPNVRSDINDKPPNPNQALPHSSRAPMAKPWERTSSTASSLSNGDSRLTETSHVPQTPEPENNLSKSGKRKSSGPWRPPPVPQASVRASFPAPKEESEVDALSVQSADRALETED